ncbi:hypothetical protein AWU67_10325 [Microterricola viridarii]|uniref:Uncharacterized protein n=1 Tax=Microterricola viridarii TaxID=412690 RepID=A0A120I146_9MICO|nr:hypothetical protein AWU67_10325 [Microterricola viridarii]
MFPLVLITIVLEQRSVHVNIRSRAWFEKTTIAVVSISLAGLVASIVGVQLGGLEALSAWPLWLLFLAAVVGLAFLLIAVLATSSIEAEAGAAKLAKRKKRMKRV